MRKTYVVSRVALQNLSVHGPYSVVSERVQSRPVLVEQKRNSTTRVPDSRKIPVGVSPKPTKPLTLHSGTTFGLGSHGFFLKNFSLSIHLYEK